MASIGSVIAGFNRRCVEMTANMAVDLAPFGRWVLRDIAAQLRSPLR